jgi:hypothetical protein
MQMRRIITEDIREYDKSKLNPFAVETETKRKIEQAEANVFYLSDRETSHMIARIEKQKEKMRMAQRKKEPQLFNDSYSFDVDYEGIGRVIHGDKMKKRFETT